MAADGTPRRARGPICSRCGAEDDPVSASLVGLFVAARGLGVRIKLEPRDDLQAEAKRAVDVARAYERGTKDPEEHLFRIERALRLVGLLRAREEAEEALRLLVDPNCDARDVHRALRRALRALRAGRVCDDGEGLVCRRPRSVSPRHRRAVCDDGNHAPTKIRKAG